MKREELLKIGVPEDKVDEIMKLNGQDIQREKNVAEKLETERGNLQAQLTEVQEKLKGFDGVNVEELKGQITQLQTDMAAKETEYQQQLAGQAFDALIAQELTAAKGKNPKAIAALLDTDALKDSKNQQADIAAAVKALKESDGYLFEADKKGGTFKGLVPGQGSVDPSTDESDYQERYDNANKTGNRTEAIAIKQEAAEAGVFL